MTNHHGKFVWYDVMTTDVPAAQTFYTQVMGWQAKDSGSTTSTYILFSKGAAQVGGLMPIPEAARASGVPPAWMGYIAVDDVDDYAKRVVQASGKVHRAPENIDGIGRFAVAADPFGAGFILFRGIGEGPSEPPEHTPGHMGWRELHAGDGKKSFAFYAALFGWTPAETVDMGPMGIYQTFGVRGAPAMGGMMTKRPDVPHPFWLYYINVEAIDAAVDRVKQAGGKILAGPHPVPGDTWIVQASDPQGAVFGMSAVRR